MLITFHQTFNRKLCNYTAHRYTDRCERAAAGELAEMEPAVNYAAA